mgnify:CR=1 FL=1
MRPRHGLSAARDKVHGQGLLAALALALLLGATGMLAQGELNARFRAQAQARELLDQAHAALAQAALPDTRALAALADMVVSRSH